MEEKDGHVHGFRTWSTALLWWHPGNVWCSCCGRRKASPSIRSLTAISTSNISNQYFGIGWSLFDIVYLCGNPVVASPFLLISTSLIDSVHPSVCSSSLSLCYHWNAASLIPPPPPPPPPSVSPTVFPSFSSLPLPTSAPHFSLYLSISPSISYPPSSPSSPSVSASPPYSITTSPLLSPHLPHSLSILLLSPLAHWEKLREPSGLGSQDMWTPFITPPHE